MAKIDVGFLVTYEMIEAGLTGNNLLVYAFLYHRTWEEGKYKKGVNALAKKLHLSVPTAIKIVHQLCMTGWIEKDYYLDENKCKRCVLWVPDYEEDK